MSEVRFGSRPEAEVHTRKSRFVGEALQRTSRATRSKKCSPSRRSSASWKLRHPIFEWQLFCSLRRGGERIARGSHCVWDQSDLASKLIRLGNDVKTPGSSEPVPLSEYACEVLQAWNKEQTSKSPYVFPSPICPDRPISTVKTAWQATLRRAGVPQFPLYNLRHVFCTRLSEVAPDAVVQRAMRHTSPETKRRYQLGMADQVRQAVERANESAYGKGKRTTFLLRSPTGGTGATENRL